MTRLGYHFCVISEKTGEFTMPLPRFIRHAGPTLTASLSVAVLAASSALPAQAASQTGWRTVFRDNCPKGC
ncbi:MAG: hypothetical protein ACYCVZ_00620, partial [Streptosporangiaceae bacterium]